MPPHTNSNTVTVSQIARHWGFTSPTVRHLLNRTGTVPLSTGPARYRWRDVWALEGAGYVPPINEAEFRRPLLTPAEVISRFFPHLKPRTISDQALKGTLPAILLGTDWRFRECDIRKAAIDG